MRRLVADLNRYSASYYNDNISLISDKEYDELFDELLALEKETGIAYSDSPTQRVGYTVKSSLTKVRHNHPLLSLGKTTDIEEFAAFFGDKPVTVSAKLDGLTCSLLYRDGVLVSGESRGNGEEGEDITHNVRTFVNLPQRIPFKGQLIVDGECIIDYDTFERIKREEDTEYKNPRNLVSGTVRQLDSSVCSRRGVRFIAWKLWSALDEKGNAIPESKSFKEGFQWLNALGFEVVPYIYCNNSINNINNINIENNTENNTIENAVLSIRGICSESGLPIDGICGAFDDVDYGLSLGSTGHHPRHSLAFKFYQERNETTLLSIEWNTTRTGLVNPVAIVEPVEIDGTTVRRASLSNVSIIKELELGIGDRVSLIKANQIIPQITDNLTRSGNYEFPSSCPCCGSELVLSSEHGREVLLCRNKGCRAQNLDRIVNYVSRNGLNITGISGERLGLLMDAGFISDFGDIYRLKEYRREMEQMEGLGELSVENMLKSIEESRRCRFSDFITAFGIPGIGRASGKALTAYLMSLSKQEISQEISREINQEIKDGGEIKKTIAGQFLNLALDGYDWSRIDDFGEIMREDINNYLAANADSYKDAVSYLSFTEDEEKDNNDDANKENQPLRGKKLCITGKLLQFANRNELVEVIEKAGGSFVTSVSSATDYLICNDKDSGSSKMRNAQKHGIPVLSEDELLELLK